jgi:hypothetical protein
MDLRRGTLGAHQLGMRQQVPANVGKLRRWSGDSPSPARWSEGDTNFVRLTGQLVRPALRHLRRESYALRLRRSNALAASPGFSVLPDIRQHRDDPGVDLARRSRAWSELGGDLLAARGSPCRAEGRDTRYAVQPCAPPLGLAAVSACREEITTAHPPLRSGVGSGRSPGCVG